MSASASRAPRSLVRPSPLREIVARWRVLLRVSRTELRGRYAGSVLGLWWLLLYPLLMLAVYAAVYLEIFRVRPVGMEPAEYVLYIFAGLVPFLASAEAITLSLTSISAQRAVIRNTVFPIELAPVRAVLLPQPAQAVGLLLCLVFAAAWGRVSLWWLALPLVWALHVAFLVGLGWILALLNLVLRDLATVVPLVLLVLYVVSPIGYTPDMVPDGLRFLFWVNPLAYFLMAYQQILVIGAPPGIGQAAAALVAALGLFVGGAEVFRRVKYAVIDYA